MSLEFALQGSNGGRGSDTNPEDDSLAQTFFGEGANYHDDSVAVQLAVDSSP
jgi:hypothetical protein